MADDDEEDCVLAMEAFRASGAEVFFSRVGDGVELMDYLWEHSRSDAKKLPDLILLDQNMPLKDGREALLEIRSNPTLREIPIVILTTSQEQSDMASSLAAGADSFITKPATFEEWVEIMKSLAERWISK